MDYRRLPRSIASHRQAGNTVAGVAIGLLIGVLIAASVALYINFGKKPFTQPMQSTTQSAPVGGSSEPVSLPGKPGDKPVEKPNYDFYKILPGGDAASMPAASAPVTEPVASEKLYLQAGAFQDPADADNLKARLALMGMEAGVQKVDTADKGVLQRVRVGPFGSEAELDGARAKLAQEGIESIPVRVKPRK